MLVVQCSSQRDWQNSLIPSSARRLYACPSFQSKLGCLDLDSVKFLWRCCRIAGCVLGSGEHSDMCGGRVGRPSVNLYRLRVLGKMEQFTQSSNIEKFIENIVIKFLAGGGHLHLSWGEEGEVSKVHVHYLLMSRTQLR